MEERGEEGATNRSDVSVLTRARSLILCVDSKLHTASENTYMVRYVVVFVTGLSSFSDVVDQRQLRHSIFASTDFNSARNVPGCPCFSPIRSRGRRLSTSSFPQHLAHAERSPILSGLVLDIDNVGERDCWKLTPCLSSFLSCLRSKTLKDKSKEPFPTPSPICRFVTVLITIPVVLTSSSS